MNYPSPGARDKTIQPLIPAKLVPTGMRWEREFRFHQQMLQLSGRADSDLRRSFQK